MDVLHQAWCVHYCSSDDLHRKLGLVDLHTELRYRHLGWFSHVQCSSQSINTIRILQVDGKRKTGRPRKMWEELMQGDLIDWGRCQQRMPWIIGSIGKVYFVLIMHHLTHYRVSWVQM